jgi:hypothetical protein
MFLAHPNKIMRTALVAAIAFGLCFESIPASAETKPQIWFSSPPTKDYMKLFSSPSEWPQSLSQVDVFELQTQFAVKAGDPMLRTMFNFLGEHHIALALEMPILTAEPNQCGFGIEGNRPQGVDKALAERLHRLGAPLKYVAMDEPLWFGHMSNATKPNGAFPCQATINDVAVNAANNIAAIRSYYPDVIVGDEEPLLNPYRRNDIPPDFWDQMQAWTKSFGSATGYPLAFIHFDIGWFPSGSASEDVKNHAHWLAQLQQAQTFTKLNGIRSGIFYNGNPGDKSGVAWDEHAEARFEEVEGIHHYQFDDVVIQSWMRQPRLDLPETTPGTISNLLMQYIQFKHFQ